MENKNNSLIAPMIVLIITLVSGAAYALDSDADIRFASTDGKTIAIPVHIYDEGLYFGYGHSPENRLYFSDGEHSVCTSDYAEGCIGAEWLIAKDGKARIIKLDSIDTENNTITLYDKTAGNQGEETSYTDNIDNTIAVEGFGNITVIVNENDATVQLKGDDLFTIRTGYGAMLSEFETNASVLSVSWLEDDNETGTTIGIAMHYDHAGGMIKIEPSGIDRGSLFADGLDYSSGSIGEKVYVTLYGTRIDHNMQGNETLAVSYPEDRVFADFNIASSDGLEYANMESAGTMWIGSSVHDIFPSIGKDRFPDMLDDGIYYETKGATGNNAGYIQLISFSEGIGVFGYYQDDADADPAGPYVIFGNNDRAYTYDLEFDDAAVYDYANSESAAEDMEFTTIEIQDKDYTIVDTGFLPDGTLHMLELMTGKSIAWTLEDETFDFNNSGTMVSITLLDVSENGSACMIDVDGVSGWIPVGTASEIDGFPIGVAGVMATGNATYDLCKLHLDSEIIHIEDGEEIRIDGEYVDGSAGYIGSVGSTHNGTWGGMTIEWTSEDMIYLAPGDSLIDPVLGNLMFMFDSANGDFEQITYNVTQSNASGPLSVEGITFDGDALSAVASHETLKGFHGLNVGMTANEDLEGLVISAELLVPDLEIVNSTGQFDMYRRDNKESALGLTLPPELGIGAYALRITITEGNETELFSEDYDILVRSGCNDRLDNDNDGIFDMHDPSCWDENCEYDPEINYEDSEIACTGKGLIITGIGEDEIDTDNDSRIDYLVMDLDVLASEEGEYYIQGILKLLPEEDDENIIVDDTFISLYDTPYQLDDGENTVRLRFSGVEIGRNVFDEGHFNLTTAVYEHDDIGEAIYTSYLTGIYGSDGFQAPWAVFSGFDDYAYSDDSDDSHEWLVIEADIEAKREGNYTIDYGLVLPSGLSFDRQIENEYLSEGANTVDLMVSGHWLASGGTDGETDLAYISITDETDFIEQDYLEDAYTTDYYNHESFELDPNMPASKDFSTIESALDTFVCFEDNVYIVIGKNADAADTFSAVELAVALEKHETCGGAKYVNIAFDDELPFPPQENIIALGGPGTNAYTENLISEDDFNENLEAGKAGIRTYDFGDHGAIAVAGTTGRDTLMAAKAFNQGHNMSFDRVFAEGESSSFDDTEVSYGRYAFNRRPEITSATDADENLKIGRSTALGITASDADSDALNFGWKVNSMDEVSNSSSYAFSPNETGEYNITATVSDGNLSASRSWTINAVSNMPPEIDTYYPFESEITMAAGREQAFIITKSDEDDQVLSVRWYVNGAAISGQDLDRLDFSEEDAGEYEIMVVVSDGSSNASHSWKVTVSDRPIADTFGGSTTDFSQYTNEELGSISGVVLEKPGRGRIAFTSAINLSGGADLDSCVIMEGGIIGIDTSCLPKLRNEAARLTLYGMGYTTVPVIYYNGGFTADRGMIADACDFCNVVSYTQYPTDNGTVVFDAEHFTVFTAGSSSSGTGDGQISDGSLVFKEITVRIDGKKESGADENGGNINDEVLPRSIITLKIELENLFADQDINDIEVKGTIKDIDDGDDIDDDDEIGRIKEDDTETVTLGFEVPLEVDEGDYDLVLTAEGKADDRTDHRTELKFTVQVDKEKHDIIIRKAIFDPGSVSCIRSTSLETVILNLGKDDEEDVVIRVSSDELGIDLEKTGIDLDKGTDSDSSYNARFDINIDDSIDEGTYSVDIGVYYDNDELTDRQTADLMVSKCSGPSPGTTAGSIYSRESPAGSELQASHVIYPGEGAPIEPVWSANAAFAKKETGFTDKPEFYAVVAICYVVLLGLLVLLVSWAVVAIGRIKRKGSRSSNGKKGGRNMKRTNNNGNDNMTVRNF